MSNLAIAGNPFPFQNVWYYGLALSRGAQQTKWRKAPCRWRKAPRRADSAIQSPLTADVGLGEATGIRRLADGGGGI